MKLKNKKLKALSLVQGIFSGGSDAKESTCNVGDLGSNPGSGRSPGEGNGNPLQYSCLQNPHGQRSLAGYHPWDRKESNTTEPLTLSQTLQLIRGQKIEGIKEQHGGSREKEVGRGM